MEEKEVKISFWASHLTLIVSVSFVLLLIGVMASVWVSVNAETHRLRDRIQINVVMSDSISNPDAKALLTQISKKPYSRNTKFISSAEAMQRWKSQTGEDLESLYGVNPLSPEVEFLLNSDYSTAPQIESIKKELMKMKGVESVDTPDSSVVKAMNANLAGISWILMIVAGVMLIVTIVLINNTVHLSIYSRRFTIHTMKLVGATNGFISRPVVGSNALCGFLGGLLASILTFGIFYIADYYGLHIFSYVLNPEVMLIISGFLMLLGIIMCALTSWIATYRYLRKDYDKLFR